MTQPRPVVGIDRDPVGSADLVVLHPDAAAEYKVVSEALHARELAHRAPGGRSQKRYRGSLRFGTVFALARVSSALDIDFGNNMMFHCEPKLASRDVLT